MWPTFPTRKVGLQLTNKALCLSWATFRTFIDSISLLFIMSPGWFIEALAFQQLDKKGKMAMERQVISWQWFLFPFFLHSFSLLLIFSPPHSFRSSFLRKYDLPTYFGHSLGMSKAVSGISWQTGPSPLPWFCCHTNKALLTFSPWRGEQQVLAARLKDGNIAIRVSA